MSSSAFASPTPTAFALSSPSSYSAVSAPPRVLTDACNTVSLSAVTRDTKRLAMDSPQDKTLTLYVKPRMKNFIQLSLRIDRDMNIHQVNEGAARAVKLLNMGIGLAEATNFAYTHCGTNDPEVSAMQNMSPAELSHYCTYKSKGPPTIHLDQDYDRAPLAEGSKQFPKMAAALDRLLNEEGHTAENVSFFYRRFPEYIPLLKAIQKLLNAERDVCSNTGLDVQQFQEYQTCRKILGNAQYVCQKSTPEERQYAFMVRRLQTVLERRLAQCGGEKLRPCRKSDACPKFTHAYENAVDKRQTTQPKNIQFSRSWDPSKRWVPLTPPLESQSPTQNQLQARRSSSSGTNPWGHESTSIPKRTTHAFDFGTTRQHSDQQQYAAPPQPRQNTTFGATLQPLEEGQTNSSDVFSALGPVPELSLYDSGEHKAQEDVKATHHSHSMWFTASPPSAKQRPSYATTNNRAPLSPISPPASECSWGSVCVNEDCSHCGYFVPRHPNPSPTNIAFTHTQPKSRFFPTQEKKQPEQPSLWFQSMPNAVSSGSSRWRF